jgi:hypothetical protein
LLLEYGCQLRVISGLGNGDVLVDRKTNQMVPPSVNIETILGHAASFLVYRVETLFPVEGAAEGEVRGCSCSSGDAKEISAAFAGLISQLKILHEGYPSSLAVSHALQGLLNESVKALEKGSAGENLSRVVIVFAAMSSGCEIETASLETFSRLVLHLQYVDSPRFQFFEQAARSVFQYAKWGALSFLLSVLLYESKEARVDFVQDILDTAVDAVTSAPGKCTFSHGSCRCMLKFI